MGKMVLQSTFSVICIQNHSHKALLILEINFYSEEITVQYLKKASHVG